MTIDGGQARALAEELVRLQFEQEPLGASLYGVPGYDDRLGDQSAAAEQAFRATMVDLAARADAVEKSTVDEADAVTLAVVAQQARTLVDRIDSHMAEYTVTDLFIGPASRILTLFPMLQLSDDD